MSLPADVLEQTVIDQVPYPLEHVPDDEARHYDAILTEPIQVGEPEIGVQEFAADTPIEIKVCVEWFDAGPGCNGDRRRGRWWIEQTNHNKLLEERPRGAYCLAVRSDETTVTNHLLIPADTFARHLIGRWTTTGSRTQCAQLPWNSILPGEMEGDR